MRRRYSAKQRAAIFAEHGGECHICGGKIGVGEAWDLDHVIPLALGGDDEPANLRPAHVKCHRGAGGKTAEDVATIAKAKRREAKHAGAVVKRPWHPRLRKKLDGTVVPR
jgi:5-methylcytosine-specific restriction protein A